MAGDADDRDLLLEALAVHLGLVPRRALDDVEETRRASTGRAGAPPLSTRLVEASLLTPEQCSVLEMLVDGLLERHGDVSRSLEALAGFGRLRAELERRRAGTPPGASANPTLPSIPAGGAGSHPDDLDEADASFLHGAIESPEGAPSPEMPEAGGRRFRIVRPHAQGGIGMVSVAFDAELRREVALKQIKPERADDPDSRARFLLEAEVTGRLEHPGIVPVYGLGRDEHGRPFYAMRFVHGDSLEAAINAFHGADADPRRDPRERSLALRNLLHRFVDVCHTIAYAHSRGVLHRDLKPANVLLGPFNESLVVDWGLAKVLPRGPAEEVGSGVDGTGAGGASNGRRGDVAEAPPGSAEGGSSGPPPGWSSSTETQAGTAFGTPAFMSPEQAEGRTDRIGPATDVYGLGAMLYMILVGRPPFDYAWGDVTAMLDRVRLGEFPRPRRANPRVPAALEAVCLKAMANDPEDRYATATELAEEVRRWLADEPVRAGRDPALTRLARWGRRHRTIVAGAAALLLTAVAALSIGIVLVGREHREAEHQRRLADERSERLRRDDAINKVNLAYREYLDDNVARGDALLDECPTDLRAWEWSYARRLGHAELTSWTPSSLGLDVWSLAFAPDGVRIAAGTGPWADPGRGATGELVVREVRGGAESFAVRGLSGAVQAVAYSPDGRRLAAAHGFSGDAAGAVLLMLDADDGRERWRAEERGVQILSLAFAPDGRSLASGCGHFNDYGPGGHVRIRDASSGVEIGPAIPGAPGGVLAVAYAPDGKTLAMTGRDVVDLHDLSDPARPLARRLEGHVNFVYAAAFSPDGRHLASGGWDQVVRIWDLDDGRTTATLAGHRGFVRGLAYAHDGRHLASAGEDRGVRRWDLDGGEGAAFHGHRGFVHCVAFAPDGVLAASGSQDGTVKVWPAAEADAQVTFRNGDGWVGALAFAPDGRTVATVHDGGVRIWDPRTGEERACIPVRGGHLGTIALAFAPDGETLAASGPERDILLWETKGWSRRGVLESPTGIRDAAFSPDGSMLAAAGEDGKVRLWDVSRRALIFATDGHEGGDNAVAFSPDGRFIAAAGADRSVRVRAASTGALVASLSGYEHGVRDVAFEPPDGRRLASVGGDYRGPRPAEIKVWDWSKGREVMPAPMLGHTGMVTAVAYFPRGDRLATTSDDRTIKLWDARTGENVLTLRGHTSGVVSLAIAADGRQLVSGSIDYSARIWTIEATDGAGAFGRSLRRAAVERVQALFARHLLKEKVLDELEHDRAMDPRLRSAAVEIAGRRTENAARLHEVAWRTIVRPIGTPEENRRALRWLEAACRVVADDPIRLAEYRHALALALYRVGEDRRALEVVADLSRHDPEGAPRAVDLAVTALACRRLGRLDEAERSVARLRELPETGDASRRREAAGFLDEVCGAGR